MEDERGFERYLGNEWSDILYSAWPDITLINHALRTSSWYAMWGEVLSEHPEALPAFWHAATEAGYSPDEIATDDVRGVVRFRSVPHDFVPREVAPDGPDAAAHIAEWCEAQAEMMNDQGLMQIDKLRAQGVLPLRPSHAS